MAATRARVQLHIRLELRKPIKIYLLPRREATLNRADLIAATIMNMYARLIRFFFCVAISMASVQSYMYLHAGIENSPVTSH